MRDAIARVETYHYLYQTNNRHNNEDTHLMCCPCDGSDTAHDGTSKV